MAEHPPQPRTGVIVAGATAAVIAVVLIAAGAFALWGDSQKDADGYLSTGTERFTTSTRALASERLDVEIDDKHWVAGVEDLGDTRLKVAAANGETVFAGIAPQRDVSAYLRGVEHTVVADIDSSPFSARHRERDGARVPAPPAEQDFWAASVQGAGPQTLHWTPDAGDWSVVVMNADGSAGVSADVSAGAEVAFLETLGWSLAGGGVLLLVAGVALIARGARPRPGRFAAPAPAPSSPGA
jgi:hypothetical protein